MLWIRADGGGTPSCARAFGYISSVRIVACVVHAFVRACVRRPLQTEQVVAWVSQAVVTAIFYVSTPFVFYEYDDFDNNMALGVRTWCGRARVCFFRCRFWDCLPARVPW